MFKKTWEGHMGEIKSDKIHSQGKIQALNSYFHKMKIFKFKAIET